MEARSLQIESFYLYLSQRFYRVRFAMLQLLATNGYTLPGGSRVPERAKDRNLLTGHPRSLIASFTFTNPKVCLDDRERAEENPFGCIAVLAQIFYSK
jgi:hypothetical protein